MHGLLAEGMRTGEVTPLPWTVYARNDMQDAFRYMASGAVLADTLPRGWSGMVQDASRHQAAACQQSLQNSNLQCTHGVRGWPSKQQTGPVAARSIQLLNHQLVKMPCH